MQHWSYVDDSHFRDEESEAQRRLDSGCHLVSSRVRNKAHIWGAPRWTLSASSYSLWSARKMKQQIVETLIQKGQGDFFKIARKGGVQITFVVIKVGIQCRVRLLTYHSFLVV